MTNKAKKKMLEAMDNETLIRVYAREFSHMGLFEENPDLDLIEDEVLKRMASKESV